MRHRKRIIHIFRELSPFVLVFVAHTFIRIEIVTLIAALLTVTLTLRHSYRKNELLLFGIGMALGFALEVCLASVYRDQYWMNASLYGVPLWLPVMWGYGFVLFRRIGDLIVRRDH